MATRKPAKKQAPAPKKTTTKPAAPKEGRGRTSAQDGCTAGQAEEEASPTSPSNTGTRSSR